MHVATDLFGSIAIKFAIRSTKKKNFFLQQNNKNAAAEIVCACELSRSGYGTAERRRRVIQYTLSVFI